MFLWILAVLFIATIVLYLLSDPERRFKGKNVVPGPKGLPFLGIGLDFVISDPVLTFKRLQKLVNDWNGRVRFNLGHHNLMLVAVPEDIEVIMTDQRFLSKSHEYDMLRPWLQDGLLTVSKKDKWQARRKALTPAFHFKILDEFVEVMDAQAKILTRILSKEANNKAFDIAKYINLYSLDVICETSMGVAVNAQTESSKYVKAVLEISEIMFWRIHHFLARDNWFFNIIPAKRRQDQLVKIIHDFTISVIENRRKEKGKEDPNQNLEANEFGIKRRKALLDILLDSNINGAPLTTTDIQEEVDNFMFAGHDTTTSAIEFLLFNLAKHQDVQKKVYSEIVSVFGSDPSEPVTLSKLNDLSYLDLVIKESLRIFPSVPVIARYIKEDIEINGNIYPAHHNVLIGIYMLHNNPAIFPEPHLFKPERFLEAKTHEKMNAFSYVPFSGGYRNCIGQKFAQYEIKTVISRIMQSFEVNLGQEGFEPALGSELILRPVNGMWLKFKQRST